MAYEILVREHHRRLLAYAHSLLAGAGRAGDHASAEDLVQDALVVAFERLDRFDPSRDFGAWVRGIVRHRFLKGARRREFTLDDAVLDGLDGIHDAWAEAAMADGAGSGDLLTALRNCLDRLGGLLRTAVEGFYFHHAPVAELAQASDSSEAAVRKRLQRGRAMLAECLDGSMKGGTA